MSNVIEFGKKPVGTHEDPSKFMLELTVYSDSEGCLEVSMDIEEGFTDFEIYQALENCAAKWAVDHDLWEEEDLMDD